MIKQVLRKNRDSIQDLEKSPDYITIQNSEYFDKNWYLAQNPDVKEAGIEFNHYNY